MFNLRKNSSSVDDNDLLIKELRVFNVIPESNGYKLEIGDECVHDNSLSGCLKHINEGIDELRSELWEIWKQLALTSEQIINTDGKNNGHLDNIVFLNSAKQAYLFSKDFTDLEEISQILRYVLDIDILQVEDELVKKFNKHYLSVKLLHKLLMTEKYRHKLINRLMQIKGDKIIDAKNRLSGMLKLGQISGPWANLDLPMAERVWEWDSGEEEYFENRKKARRQQNRYNTENNNRSGFFYVWQDLNRDPYRFEDMQRDSPYKYLSIATIP